MQTDPSKCNAKSLIMNIEDVDDRIGMNINVVNSLMKCPPLLLWLTHYDSL